MSREDSLSRITEQRQSMQKIHSDNEQARIAKHQKLIEMIHQYARSHEDEQKLSRLRRNTVLQIDIRYRNSRENKIYIFPRRTKQDLQEEEQNHDRFCRNLHYDLHSQNQPVKKPSQSQFMQVSRRIKSLDQVVVGIHSEKIIRRGNRLQTDLDYNRFSLSHKPKILKSQAISKTGLSNHIVLPILGKKLKNLKTEISPQQNKQRIEKLIMKKLVTETYDEPKNTIISKFNFDKSLKMKRNKDILH